MDESRHDVRRRLKQAAAKAELAAQLERTAVPPARRDAAYLVHGCGRSRAQAAMELHAPTSHVDEAIAAAYGELGRQPG